MPEWIDKNGATNIDAMSIIGGNNIMKLQKCSLFIAVVGAVLLTAAFAPTANAFVVVVYNFEDSTVGASPPDFTADVPPGLQSPLLMTTSYPAAGTVGFNPNDMRSEQLGGGTGIPANVAPGDLDPNLLAVALTHAKTNNDRCINFTVNTIGLTQLSLSFAYNNNGNGFTTATFQFSTNGGTSFTTISTSTLTTGGNFVATSLTAPAAAENQASVIFQICFSGGTSNGNDVQTLIDNVRLDAAPEPATVMSGLLSVGGLCWVQRRRLIRFVRLRRT
jgi:hypothetical protein